MDIKKIINDLVQYKTQIIEILSGYDWRHFRLYFSIRENFLKGNFSHQSENIFCRFYSMNGPMGLNSSQKEKFFQLLTSREKDLKNILGELYEIRGHGGIRKLFLSFSTKLLHTLDVTLPIYDGHIAHILELQKPNYSFKEKDKKIENRIKIYDELKNDIRKLLENKKIRDCLKYIRKELTDKAERENFQWKDRLVLEEKLLDSALWALYEVRKCKNKRVKS